MTFLRLLATVVAMTAVITSPVESAVPLTGAVRIAAGYLHTCALTAAGGVKCWGDNYSGELGDGSTTDSGVAVDVHGLASGVAAVEAGTRFTCARTTAGGVKCWGANWAGQLGNGTTTDAFTPVDVIGVSTGVVAIAAGNAHACALTATGGIKCWGYNDYGQLGNGTRTNASAPVDVSGLASGVTAIAAGGDHTCAVTETGGVKCWGKNFSGQLGEGTTTTVSNPVDVSGLTSGVSAVTNGGAHTCALTLAGGVLCWGANGQGQLGNGTTISALTPVQVSGLASGAGAVEAGWGSHTCVLTTAGGVKCWGNNEHGQLGNGTTASAPTPVDATGLTSGVAGVAAGGDHTCAVTVTGGARCWGWNLTGQLGDGELPWSPVPVEATGLASGVRTIAAGGLHSCAVTAAGGAQCWGMNDTGQLGNGTTINAATAVDVTGLTSGMVAVAAGWSHTCALHATGGVKCWGENLSGQLGNGRTTTATTPVGVIGLASGVAAITAGGHHSCALTVAGGVKCWGDNTRGQLGNGTTTSSTTPVDVTGLTSGVVAVRAGGSHTCAVTAAGGGKCWGYNAFGQLGNGTTTNASIPVDIAGLSSGVKAIAPGVFHTCAVTTSGAAKCWGLNNYGQLGDGTRTNASVPVPVSGLASGVAAMAAGGPIWSSMYGAHSCALTATGAVKCWGLNSNGQLGDGTTTDAQTPVDVTGLASGVAAITAGAFHTCAVTLPLGRAKCWGENWYGQLAVAASMLVTTPQGVVDAACADFADVSPTSSFCRNVEWLRNRAITLGCTTVNDFCPIDAVSRFAMAAFMNRLGTALTLQVASTQAASGALDPDAKPVVCTTTVASSVDFPRRIHLDAVFAATSAGSLGIVVEPVASPDGGTTWYALTSNATQVLVRAGHWTNGRVLADVDADVGQALQFGLRVGRGGAPGGATLGDSTCNLRLRIENRNGELSPY